MQDWQLRDEVAGVENDGMEMTDWKLTDRKMTDGTKRTKMKD